MPKVPTEPLPPLTTRGTVRKNRLFTPEENIQKAILLIRNGVYMARAGRIAGVPLKRLEARVNELRESGELDLYWGKNAPRHLEQLEAEEESSQNETEEVTPNSGTEKKEKKRRQVRHFNYTAEDVENAAQAVRQGLYTVNAAHNVYRVSRRAIKLVLQGEPATAWRAAPGNAGIQKRGKLKAEEEQVVKAYAMALHKLKHPVYLHSMVPCARQLLKRRQLTMKETYGWWSGFKKRHKEVGKLCTESKEVKSYSREHWVKLYFDRLTEVYDVHNFYVKPSRIYACDFLDLLVQRWMKSSRPEGIRLMKVDILVAANATGYHVLPPCVVYRNDTETIPDFLGLPEAGFVFAEEGRITGAILLEWFRTVLLRYLPARSKEDPIILIMQGANSLLSAELVSLAEEEHVLLVLMNTEVHLLLSPLVILLHKLRSTYRTKIEEFTFSNQHLHHEIKEPFYPVTLRNIFSTTFNMSEIQEVFKIKGVFPLNPDKVDPASPVILADEKSDKPVSESSTRTSKPLAKKLNAVPTSGPITVPGNPAITLNGFLPLSPLAPAIPIALRQADRQPQIIAESISRKGGVSVNPQRQSAAVPVTSAAFTKGTPEPESNLTSSEKLSKASNTDVQNTILIVKKRCDNLPKACDAGRDGSSTTSGRVASPTGGHVASQTSAAIPSEVIVPFELVTAPDTTAPRKVTNESSQMNATTKVTNAIDEVTDAAMEVTIESDEVVDVREVTNITSEVANVISELSNITGEVNDSIIEVTIASNEVIVESDEVTTACSEVTNSASEVTNTSSAVTNKTSEVTNTTIEVTNTISEVTNVADEVTNVTLEVADESDEVATTSSEVTIPREVTIVPVNVTNEAGKVTNASNTATTSSSSSEVTNDVSEATNEVCLVTIESDEESSGSSEVICLSSSEVIAPPSSVTRGTSKEDTPRSKAIDSKKSPKSQRLLSLFTEMCEMEVRREAGNSQDSSQKATDGSLSSSELPTSNKTGPVPQSVIDSSQKATDGSSSSELTTCSGTPSNKTGPVPQSVIDSSQKATDGSSSSELTTCSGTPSDKTGPVPQSVIDSSQKATDGPSSSSELPTPSGTSSDKTGSVPQSVIDSSQKATDGSSSSSESTTGSGTSNDKRGSVPPAVIDSSQKATDGSSSSELTTASGTSSNKTGSVPQSINSSKKVNNGCLSSELHTPTDTSRDKAGSVPQSVVNSSKKASGGSSSSESPTPGETTSDKAESLPQSVINRIQSVISQNASLLSSLTANPSRPPVPPSVKRTVESRTTTTSSPIIVDKTKLTKLSKAFNDDVMKTVLAVKQQQQLCRPKVAEVRTPQKTPAPKQPQVRMPPAPLEPAAIRMPLPTPVFTPLSTQPTVPIAPQFVLYPMPSTQVTPVLVPTAPVIPVTPAPPLVIRTVAPVAPSSMVTAMVTGNIVTPTITATKMGKSAVASTIATVSNETGQSVIASKRVTPAVTKETAIASKTVTAPVTNITGQSVVVSKIVTPIVTNETGVTSKKVTPTVTNKTVETSVTPIASVPVVITNKTVTPEVTCNTNSTTKESCSHAPLILLKKKKTAREEQDAVAKRHDKEQNKNRSPNQRSISPSLSSKDPKKQNNQSGADVKRTARKQSIVTSDPDSNKDGSPDIIQVDTDISSDINKEDQRQSHDNIKEAKDKSCDIREKDNKSETVCKGDENYSTTSGRESRRRKAHEPDTEGGSPPTPPKKARIKVESDAMSSRRTRAMTKQMSPIRRTRSMKK